MSNLSGVRRVLFMMMLLPLVAWLGACATSLPVDSSTVAPVLRLAPATLGRAMALQQHVIVEARGRTDAIDVLLEVDATAVRLAVLSTGQTAARLEWDGTTLSVWRAPWWPDVVKAERILSDLQFIYWPVAAIRGALPAGWSLDVSSQQRVLRYDHRVVMTIRYPTATAVELTHQLEAYRLRIETSNLEAPR